jgi:hypothetical protein
MDVLEASVMIFQKFCGVRFFVGVTRVGSSLELCKEAEE